MELSQYYNAQVAVLGSLMIDPDKLAGKIFRSVRDEDFSEAPVRNVFRAAKEIFLAGAPLDAVTVCDRAGSGYAGLIRQAMDATPTLANIDEYIRIMQDSARLHHLRGLAEKMADAMTWAEGKKLLEEASRILSDRPNRRASSYTELISRYLDRQNDNTPPWQLDWGLESLTRNLFPSRGWFVIIGADSSVGKTALALQMALAMAKDGTRVAFYSYETNRDEVAYRLLANAAEVGIRRSVRKTLTDADFRRVSSEGIRSERVSLDVIESAFYTVDDLRAEVISCRYEVIFIDYVQLIPAGRSDNRFQTVTAASMALHSMAQELGVVVVALSQVTLPEKNMKTGKRPMVHKENLRESSQLVKDADVIMMMDLEDPLNPASRRVLNIEKNKNDALAKLYLTFDPEHMRFSDRVPLKPVTFEDLDDSDGPNPF